MKKTPYLEYVLDIFSIHDGISFRAMFGGYGIYKNKVIFAIIADDELYFKVDSSNKQQYIDMGSNPFSYDKGDKIVEMSYWQVPVEILEDTKTLYDYIEQSYQISLKTKR